MIKRLDHRRGRRAKSEWGQSAFGRGNEEGWREDGRTTGEGGQKVNEETKKGLLAQTLKESYAARQSAVREVRFGENLKQEGNDLISFRAHLL